MILAFFPCTRFEDQIMLGFKGQNCGMATWTQEDKLLYSIKLHEELHEYYTIVSYLALIAIRRGLQLIIENPYSAQHYLRNYWSVRPAIIDKDRTERGDWYKKPTQYFFINRMPQNNLVMEVQEYTARKRLKWDERNPVQRSMIHPQYARRFIKEFILEQ